MAEKKPYITDPSRQCTAKSRTTGEQCRQRAMVEQTKCRFHGGKSPNALKKARERATEKKILTELERGKLTGKALVGTTDPLGELQKLTTELVHFKDQLTQRVNDLGDYLANYDDKGSETVKVEIDIYLKIIDKLTKTLDIALKHDIEGKKIAIEQAKADLVAGLIIRTLIHSGLAGEQLDGAKTYMYQQLKEIGQA